MTRIDSSNQIADLLRRRLEALKGSAEATSAKRNESSRADSRRATQGTPQNDIANVLARRVELISPDDPDRQSKAFRAFLEAMLLAEFGESLINDPAFYQMVDHVQQQMQGDQHLAEAIEEASKILLSGNVR